eukprot:2712499-Rhodomonas_salina.1
MAANGTFLGPLTPESGSLAEWEANLRAFKRENSARTFKDAVQLARCAAKSNPKARCPRTVCAGIAFDFAPSPAPAVVTCA